MTIRGIALRGAEAIGDTRGIGKAMRHLTGMRHDGFFFGGHMRRDIDIKFRLKPDAHQGIGNQNRASEPRRVLDIMRQSAVIRVIIFRAMGDDHIRLTGVDGFRDHLPCIWRHHQCPIRQAQQLRLAQIRQAFLGFFGALGGKGRPRLASAFGAIGGDNQRQAIATGFHGRQATIHKDFKIIRMGANGCDI